MALKAILEGKATAVPVVPTTATVAATVVSPVAVVASGIVATTSEFTDVMVRTAMSAALSQISKSESAIRQHEDAESLTDAEDYVIDAKDQVISALRAYIRNDFETAYGTFTKAKKTAAKTVAILEDAV
jgi:hypothetical protein